MDTKEIIITDPGQIKQIVDHANQIIADRLFLGPHTLGCDDDGAVTYPAGNVEGSMLPVTVRPAFIRPPIIVERSGNCTDPPAFRVRLSALEECCPDEKHPYLLSSLKSRLALGIIDLKLLKL